MGDGTISALCILGEFYAQGEYAEFTQGDTKALECYNKALQKGYQVAHFYIAKLMAESRAGFKRDITEIIKKARIAAELNYKPAQYQLGIWLIEHREIKEGIAWLERVASENDGDTKNVQFKLGEAYIKQYDEHAAEELLADYSLIASKPEQGSSLNPQ